ncbi:uncharacterized protein B0H18DRAFT_1124190 [Fomitopsis serialis]|uniref:uncharacterized protein n=1 Tax=Fomitopsis serialis TaxID=139415 RepID=UPI0020072E0C|nr:uncharacterized protein B0H18DRAFT_1124190 [Neoantrodia serialis]KAH9916461.1 hypothetical protein B0H18DRAFT_1124190 [Neoantrodia serialis]
MYQQLRTEFNDFRELILGPDCLLPAHEADTGSVPPEASGSGTRHDPEVPMQDVDNDVDRNEDRAPSPAIKNDVDMNHDRAPSAAIDNDVEMDHDRAPSASITLPEGTEDVAAGMEMDWSAENETGQADERSPSRGVSPVHDTPPPPRLSQQAPRSPSRLQYHPSSWARTHMTPRRTCVPAARSCGERAPPEPAYAPPPLPPCDGNVAGGSEPPPPNSQDTVPDSQPPVAPSQDVLPGTTPAEQQSPKDAQENVVDTRANEPDDEPGIGPQGRSAEPAKAKMGNTRNRPVLHRTRPDSKGLGHDSAADRASG